MKKIFILLVSLFCFFMSCEKEASDYVKQANKAIEKKDYQKAYNIYDEMVANNPHRGIWLHGEQEAEYDNAADKLKDTIIKSEIASAIEESEGASNMAKIVYIIEERGNNLNGYYEYAIKIAKAAGNNELANGISSFND